MRPLGTRLGNIHFVIYTLVLDIYSHQLDDICQLEGVSAPFVLGFGEYMHFVIFTLVLDICCQRLGDICQLEGVCDSVCPLVSELGNMHFVIY